MSVDIVREVREYSRARGVPREVLVALAELARADTREVYSYNGPLAGRVGRHPSAVRRAVTVLVGVLRELELVTDRRGGRGRAPVYRVVDLTALYGGEKGARSERVCEPTSGLAKGAPDVGTPPKGARSALKARAVHVKARAPRAVVGSKEAKNNSTTPLPPASGGSVTIENLEEIWGPVHEELRQRAPDFKWHIWLRPLELVAVAGKTMWISAPEHIRTAVEERYSELIRQAAVAVLGDGASFMIVAEDWTPQRLDARLPEATGVGALAGMAPRGLRGDRRRARDRA